MKLIVQVPCLNEEETLPAVVRDIPRQIDGIDEVEILIIDDGSTDRTSEIAKELGVDHIVRFAANRGLGHAFSVGMDFCLAHGADIIINTDGDNQYFGGDIAKLVRPILDGKADLVIGDREPGKIAHFSPIKKHLQTLGSLVVSGLAGISVPDVASGFRAYSREAAMRLACSTNFDHTVDHTIQAGRKRIATVSIPIRTNEKLRESRLFSNIGEFVVRSLAVMVRVFSAYKPMPVFSTVGVVAISLGMLLGVRFLVYLLFTDEGRLHVQSLILAAILLLAGFQMILTGIVAELINSNRALIEELSYRVRRRELSQLLGDDAQIGPRIWHAAKHAPAEHASEPGNQG
jgi:glycosyltransferase involved in cell wall biosynthesis